MEHLLELQFKGNRKYLHGTDIYSSIIDFFLTKLSETFYLKKISFKALVTKQCLIVDIKPEDRKKILADIRLKMIESGSVSNYWLVQSDYEVDKSYEYDEKKVVGSSIVDHYLTQIVDMANSSYSPIEQIVALTKKLNYEVAMDQQGKWMFGQLDMVTQLPSLYGVIRIKRVNVVNNKFSVNEIYLDDTYVGSIRFIIGVTA